MPFEIMPWCELWRRDGARDAAKALRDIKECNFTGSCFVTPKHVPLCRKIGLHPYVLLRQKGGDYSIYQHNAGAFETDDFPIGMLPILRDRNAAPDEVEAVIKTALEDVPEGPATVFLYDEPGAALFKTLRAAADAIKKYRPDLTPYIVLFPNYAVCGNEDMSQLHTKSYEEYLDRYAKELGDIPLTLDNYSAIISDDLKLPAETERFFQNYVQAREACDKYGVTFRHTIDSNQLRPWLTVPTPANLMLQAFSSLAAGARAVEWYTYFARGLYYYSPVMDFGETDFKTPVWYWLREVNRRLYSFGKALYTMPFKGMYFYGLDIPRGKSVAECPEIADFSADAPCMIGVYDYNGKPAVFVANCDVAHSNRINLELSGKPMLSFSTEEEKFIPLSLLVGDNATPTWLAPGDAILFCEE